MPSARDPISLLNASILQENEHNFLKRSDLAITVRHDRVIIYKGRDSAMHGKKRDPLCDENLKKRSYQGILSKAAGKFISKQLGLWADSMECYNRKYKLKGRDKKRQLVFLTVTLPASQIHSDQHLKRHCLVPFIDILKYHYKIEHYFWRAEAQHNGNIHFHILLDKYIDKKDAQNLWNQILERQGYVTRFAKKHKHFRPPTTHIKMIRDSGTTIKYVLKYVTKQGATRPLKGRLWGMSDSLRCLRVPSFFCDGVLLNNILQSFVSKKSTMLFDEHYMIFSYDKPVIRALYKTSLATHVRDYYYKVYSYLYFEDLPFDSDQGMTIYQGLELDEIKSITRGLYIDV